LFLQMTAMQMTAMTDEEIAQIHPAHSGDSIRLLLPRLHLKVLFFCLLHVNE
jgi:quinolinate synthase